MSSHRDKGMVGKQKQTESSRFESIDELEEHLTRPSHALVEAIRQMEGDLMVLGAGGKMGPTLTVLAQRAVEASGKKYSVIAVSRFSDPATANRLQRAGVKVVPCDLMADGSLASLPDAPNIIYMVGTKFGATGNEARTWAVNAFLPGLIARRFQGSRFVVFSSGNVYPFVPVASGGCTETSPPGPVGEYAQSVLGRERVFEHFSRQLGIQAVLFRLNYAVEMRYGVLLDIARKVWTGEPIDLRMGHVNVIWQSDANAFALRALGLATVPPRRLNVTGPETVSVRAVAHRFGELLDREPKFSGSEEDRALLSNAGQAFALLGYPAVPLGRMIEWVAAWVIDGQPVLEKPTKFEVRNGRF